MRSTHKPEDERGVVLAVCRALIAQGIHPGVKRVAKLVRISRRRVAVVIRELEAAGELEDCTEDDDDAIQARIEQARAAKVNQFVMRAAAWASVPRSRQRIAM